MVRAPHRARVRGQDVTISVATVTRWLHKLGVHRLDHLDVDSEPPRKPGIIKAWWPDHMLHIDVKKVGKIPDGGGWGIRGINSDQAHAAHGQPPRPRRALPGWVTPISTLRSTGSLAWSTPRPSRARPQRQRSVSSSEHGCGSPHTASLSLNASRDRYSIWVGDKSGASGRWAERIGVVRYPPVIVS